MEERVLGILNQIDEQIGSYEGQDLLEDGIIDSFTIMQIVSDLEDEFLIEVNPESIIAENFRTVRTIINMVKQCI